MTFFIQPIPAQVAHSSVFKEKGDVGLFIGPIVNMSNIHTRYRFLTGIQAALTYGDFFGGIFGLSASAFEISDRQERYDLKLGYGGLWLGYRPFVEKAIHPFFGLKLGWGQATLEHKREIDSMAASDGIMVTQIEQGIEIAAAKFLRIILTSGYKWISDPKGMDVLQTEDRQGLCFSVALLVGRF